MSNLKLNIINPYKRHTPKWHIFSCTLALQYAVQQNDARSYEHYQKRLAHWLSKLY